MAEARRRVVLLGIDGMSTQELETYVRRGLLPNLDALLRSGTYARALPAMSAKTPQNWATIATGANPGRHGIIDLFMQEHDQPFGRSRTSDFHNGFSSRWLRPGTEFIWSTLERQGKLPAVVNYAGAHPNVMTRGIFVGGDGSPYKDDPYALRDVALYATDGYLRDQATQRDRERVLSLGTVDGSNPFVLEPEPVAPGVVPGPCVRALKATLNLTDLVGAGGTSPSTLQALLVDPFGRGFETLLLFGATDRPLAELRVGGWSELLELDLSTPDGGRRGAARARLVALSADGAQVAIYVSQVYPVDGFSEPADVAGQLTQALGPFIEYAGETYATPEMMLDLGRWQGEWIAAAAGRLVTEFGADLVYTKIHLIDHFNHHLYGFVDPVSAWYDVSLADVNERILEDAYRIVDDMVGIVRRACGPSTVVVVVSDHGVVPFARGVSINNILARAGIVSCQPSSDDPAGRPTVDWARTRAFAVAHSGTVYVNLAGRDVNGCVSPDQFEAVQEEVIDALLDFKDPETGRRPIQLALKNRDCEAIGLSGPAAGDVIVAGNPGYAVGGLAFPLRNDLEPIAVCGPESKRSTAYHFSGMQADHGSGLPNQAFGRGSDLAVFAIAGPGIRAGYRRTDNIRLTDVAPTICHLLGVDGPIGAEGAILWDCLATEPAVDGVS